jgi:serine/threonine-protein kinase
MMSGRVPFPGEGFGDVLIKHIREPPPLLTRLNPQVPKSIEKIVLHALAKKPEFRFATMDEFRTALRDPERFVMTMDSDKGLHLTPSDPLPAQTLNGSTKTPFDDMPVTLLAPNSAPARLNADARTVQGEAPPEVKAAIEARKRGQPVANANRDQAVTAPSAAAARLSRPTMAEPAATLRRSRKRGRGGLIAGSALGALAVMGVVLWVFVLGPVSVTITSTPDGVEILQGDKVVAHTPAKLKLARGSAGVELVFRKEGFLEGRRSITPSSDQELKVRLLPKPEEEPEPPPPPPRPLAVAPPKPVPAKPQKPITQAAAPRPARPSSDHPRPHKKHKKEEAPLILTPSF